MKFSFSVPSTAQPVLKRPNGGEDSDNDEGFKSNREYVTEFDSSESPPENSKIPKNLVIPPKPNEWNPQNQSDGGKEARQFDVDSTSVDAAADSVAYGLNLRDYDNVDNAVELNTNLIPAGVDPSFQKLREDLDRLPDAGGLDDYDEVPVEGYGRALLAGYGWHDGMGIGRNAKEDVKVVELKSWSGIEGLGFNAVDHPQNPANLQQEGPML